MTEDDFWNLIEGARQESGGDLGCQVELLREHFEVAASAEALLAFRDRWDDAEDRVFTWPVWDAACVLLGFVSDDFFSDVRAWIISHGRMVLEKVAADPDMLVDLASDVHSVNSAAAEELGDLVWHLWERLSGEDENLPEGRPSADLSGDRIDLKDWSVVRARFPQLTEFRETTSTWQHR